ncbi:MAG TPA: DUF4160 domain-containing protein [Stellaceae bacterium]|nr:DUF4160 domain-containing protein [Stellaceae bacterium]
MPTVVRFHGWRVVVYPNDHRPAHVHVFGGGGEAVFILNCPQGPPELRESYAYDRGELTRMQRALGEKIADLCNE